MTLGPLLDVARDDLLPHPACVLDRVPLVDPPGKPGSPQPRHHHGEHQIADDEAWRAGHRRSPLLLWRSRARGGLACTRVSCSITGILWATPGGVWDRSGQRCGGMSVVMCGGWGVVVPRTVRSVR